NRSRVLDVPSAWVHEEANAVLNPNHSEFVGVKMTIERDFQYDGRLFAPRRSSKRSYLFPTRAASRVDWRKACRLPRPCHRDDRRPTLAGAERTERRRDLVDVGRHRRQRELALEDGGIELLGDALLEDVKRGNAERDPGE